MTFLLALEKMRLTKELLKCNKKVFAVTPSALKLFGESNGCFVTRLHLFNFKIDFYMKQIYPYWDTWNRYTLIDTLWGPSPTASVVDLWWSYSFHYLMREELFQKKKNWAELHEIVGMNAAIFSKVEIGVISYGNELYTADEDDNQ